MPHPAILTVTLNPAIDRVIEVNGFTLGSHQVGRDRGSLAAGKGINVSRVLASLGIASSACGFLGGRNRRIYDDLFRDTGIGDEFITLDGATRENITIADPQARQETHIRDAGLAVTAKDVERLTERLGSLIQPGGIVVFCGSLPPGMTAEEFGSLIDLCMKSSARVAVDTSGPALAEAGRRPLWLVKPNLQELGLLTRGGIEDLPGALTVAAGVARQVEIVLLTCGADGAYLFSGDTALHARTDLDPSRIASTVGCGDSLLGAFLAGICRHSGLAEAFIDGVACASASACTFISAQFDQAVMRELRGGVRVEPVR